MSAASEGETSPIPSNGHRTDDVDWLDDVGDVTLHRLGDFTTTRRVLFLSLIALGIGILSAVVAMILLRGIGLLTNLLYFGRWDFTLVSPAGNHLGVFAVLIPVAGGLIAGLMARYGSDKIRGHGIPEAIESILLNGSRVEPKVAVLKPVSSAIVIGSGGPFGAEGPIIMTGAAFGSMIAQLIHLTSAERKTLLVAGAAGGMAATFSSPVAAVLLGLELLLFEWKPRSMIPVVVASASATFLRRYLIGLGPIFPTTPHSGTMGLEAVLGCVLVGLIAGGMAWLLTMAVYGSEDGFAKLPIHWMWWPALGGLVVGIGGLIYPRALGVGYDVIDLLLKGNVASSMILGILIVKSIIWSVSLGSGTSGGVLAPLLMIGGAMGAAMGHILPNQGPGFWAIVAMGAVLGATIGAPVTTLVFVLETTHDVGMLLPLLITISVAFTVAVLTMRRSILTEKVSRRGYHLSREYAVDPLEILFVREVMDTDVVALPMNISLAQLKDLFPDDEQLSQGLYPVVDVDGELRGVITSSKLYKLLHMVATSGSDHELKDAMLHPAVAYPDEPLRAVVYRMAETGLTRFPVVDRKNPGKLLGMISLRGVLKARGRNLEAERRRERVLPLRVFFPFGSRISEPPTKVG